MATTVEFSSTGALTTGYPKDDNRSSIIRTLVKVTVVNSETVTLTHAEESERLREVRVINASGVKLLEPATAGTNTGVTITRASATSTTLAFGSAAAGTYLIVLEY